MNIVALYTVIIISSSFLVIGYLGEYPIISILSIVIASIWVFLERRSLSWAAGIGLLLHMILVGFGLVMEMPFYPMYFAAVFGLLGWDISDFRKRISLAGEDDDVAGVEKAHFVRLLIFAFAAAGVGIFISEVEISLGYWLVLILISIGAGGLQLLLKRREN